MVRMAGTGSPVRGLHNRAGGGLLLPELEMERLASLRSYEILDSSPETAYDNLVGWASALLGAPFVALNLVDADRAWAKAGIGLPRASLPRHLTICSEVVAMDAPIAIADLRQHPGYGYITDAFGLLSYVGVPITGRDGLVLGTLCIADVAPRPDMQRDVTVLTGLAQHAGALLELRRNEGRAGLAPQGSACDKLVADAHDPRKLRRALAADEFVPYFQPVVDLSRERVVGYEALVRWAHPTLGVLSPDRFLPAFEAGELILSLDARVLERALGDLAQLRGPAGTAERHVAVNVSGRELTAPGLADRVAEALTRHAMAPGDLVIEVTETTETNPVIRQAELRRLLDLGVGVLIDDYGSGYANTCAMLETPATGVKIDRSIVSRVVDSQRARLLLAGVTGAATRLGLTVIAEGVEDLQTARIAADCGVHRAQGYAFGRPAPAADVR